MRKKATGRTVRRKEDQSTKCQAFSRNAKMLSMMISKSRSLQRPTRLKCTLGRCWVLLCKGSESQGCRKLFQGGTPPTDILQSLFRASRHLSLSFPHMGSLAHLSAHPGQLWADLTQGPRQRLQPLAWPGTAFWPPAQPFWIFLCISLGVGMLGNLWPAKEATLGILGPQIFEKTGKRVLMFRGFHKE